MMITARQARFTSQTASLLTTKLFGGGVYFRGNTYYLTNSIFIGNEAGGASDSKGGAVFF